MFEHKTKRLDFAAVQLAEAAHFAMEGDADTTRERIRRAVAMLGASGDASHGLTILAPPETRSTAVLGLPRWIALRVVSHIEDRLTGRVRIDEVARFAGLSVSHFSRVFRQTFGTTPHSYVMGRRIDLAQTLMLSTERTLADIAITCGMADQAHFTRCFRRKTGATPREWRRAHRDALLASSEC
jgi:AraC family transcriptional regulator